MTGFYSYLFGRSGIEQAENSQLDGSDPSLVFRRLIDMVTGKRQQGASVALTINPRAQKAAVDGLNDRSSTVPWSRSTRRPARCSRSASTPSYDPNELASHDLQKVDDNWQKLLKSDPRSRC